MPEPIFTCECGFPVYTATQAEYHLAGTCKRMRRLMSTLSARERNGITEHDGLTVDGLTLSRPEEERKEPWQ